MSDNFSLILGITLIGWSIHIFKTKCKWYGRPFQVVGVLIYTYITLWIYFSYLQQPLGWFWSILKAPYHLGS